MRVNNKLFPYPVLCSGIDNYKNNKFEVDLEVEKEINNIKFKCKVTIEDDKLKELLEEEKVEILYHIECSKTLYRDIYCTKQLIGEIFIEEKKLNGKVDICCFIVAKQNLEAYSNENFNEDYDGASFEILKGQILGFYNIPRIEFIKNVEELSQISSIFSVLKKQEFIDGMAIELNGDKIKVWLGENEFEQYRIFAKTHQALIHQMLVFPALMYALDMIMKDGEEEYEEYRWFKAIDRILVSSKMNLTKESIEQNTSYKLAQKLLNIAIHRAFKELNEVRDKEGKE